MTTNVGSTSERCDGWADVLVVGSGVAGLATALTAARRGRSVSLVTKTELVGGSSPWARGGMAAALASGDSPAEHARDTETVGRDLCDHEVVRILTEGAPATVEALLELGARFDHDEHDEEALLLGREGGHSRARIVHAGGDRTGAELVRVLVRAVRANERITVIERFFAKELLIAPGTRRVFGVSGFDQAGAGRTLLARAVVLATGGAGQLYAYTTNPPEVTGDGIAMAARAGALLADLEMVQFHPTALEVGALDADSGDSERPLPLLTEALRGAGAELIGASGDRFMVGIHPLAELAPRDVVARVLWERGRRGERSFLDLRALERRGALAREFPSARAACLEAGLDPQHQPVPVTPAAHYLVGGIWTDRFGRTSLPGLWACGEAAATGAHGANRLASNSLLEALVFGHRVADAALGALEPVPALVALPAMSVGSGTAGPGDADRQSVREARRAVRQVMWRQVGLVRDEEGLRSALAELERLSRELPDVAPSDRVVVELRNMLLLGRLVAAAALQRRESRGCHLRGDYPDSSPAWQRRQITTSADLLGTVRRPGATPVAVPWAAAGG